MNQTLIHNAGTYDTPAGSVRNSDSQSPLSDLQARPVSLPTDLTSKRIFVVFKLVPQPPKTDGTPVKDKKVPYQAAAWLRGRRIEAKVNDPSTFSTFQEAVNCVRSGKGDAIGFRVPDGYTLIDVDDVIIDGVINQQGREFIDTFRGTHTHVSMSGGGLHALCKGELPKARKLPEIELYCGSTTGRFCAVPIDPLGFSGDAIMDCQSVMDDLWERYGEPERLVTPAMPVSVSMDARDVIEHLQAQNDGGKASRLLSGDSAGFKGKSEARFSLAGAAAFYTDDVVVIEEILLASGLLDHHPERDRTRRARLDATEILESYSGPRYDPDYSRNTTISITVPTADDPEVANLNRDELLALIRKQTAVIESERTARMEAEYRAKRAESIRTDLHKILRNKDLNAGARLTAFAIAMDLNARTINGETPVNQQAHERRSRRSYPVQAFRAPSARYADTTGHSPQTVAKHMRELESKGLLEKHIVREETNADDIDPETGEIVTIPGKRDVNYIALPGNDVINLVERIATYQRPEGDETGKHGGKREPRPACEQHPNAGTFTVKHEHIECAECGDVLQESAPKRKYHAPEESDGESSPIKLIADNTSVTNVYSDIKLIPDKPEPVTSPIKMVSDPPIVSRCTWNLGEGEECGEPTEAWEHEGYGSETLCTKHAEQYRRRRSFRPVTESGIYRGEVAS